MYLIPIGNESLYTALYAAFRSVTDPYFASLVFAMLQVAILWLVAWVLHKRNIIISL
jgi:predicted acyltransferase